MSNKKIQLDSIITGLKDMWETGDLSDVNIQVESQTFACHKTFLALVSGYFRSMFSSGMREAVTGTVKIEDMDPDLFRDLLQYVYTGDIELTVETAIELVQMAAFLQIQTLQKICEEFLTPAVDVDNCLRLWKIAILNNCNILYTTTMRKIAFRFETIVKSDEFFLLDVKEIVRILANDNLNIEYEEKICSAALSWLEKESTRKSSAHLLLEHIRLPFLRAEYLLSLENTDYINSNKQCMAYISEAKAYQLLPARQHEFENSRFHVRSTSEFMEVVMVLGGCESTKPPYTRSRRTYCYSFTEEVWYEVDMMPYDPGIEFCAVTYHSDIYVTGGGMMQLSLLWYDVSRNKWSQMSSMINGRRRHASVALSDALYVLGGYDSDLEPGTQMLDSIEKYIISEDRWEESGVLSIAVSCFAAIVDKDSIFTFGGEKNDREDTDLIQCYNTILMQTTEIGTKIPMACKLTRACVINNDSYLIFYDGRIVQFKIGQEQSKSNTKQSCKVVGRYNSFQKTHFGVVQHQGQIIVIGGVIENTTPCKDFLAFDPISKTTKTLDDQLFSARLVDGCVRCFVPKKYLEPYDDDFSV